MKKHLIILSFLCTLSLSAQTTGIHFVQDTLPNLLAKAKQENKLIFIDAYTVWCGPCKWMDAEVFPLDTVGKIYNSAFISTKMDMEKGQGLLLAKKYNVQCYPTYLFLDSDGNLVHRASSTMQQNYFLQLAVTAQDPAKRFGYFESKYASGTANISEFIQYVWLLNGNCLPYKHLVEDYEKKQTPATISSRDSWRVLNALISSDTSIMFQYFITHRSEYDAKYTPDSVDMVIDRMYYNKLLNCIWADTLDTVVYGKLRNEVLAMNQPIAHRIVQRADIDLYELQKDWNRYAAALVSYMKVYAIKEDYTFLNNHAYQMYQMIDDISQLKEALSWARLSVAMQPDGFNTDTYAALLYKLGRYTEAKTWAKISIALEEEAGGSTDGTKELLRDIEAKMK